MDRWFVRLVAVGKELCALALKLAGRKSTAAGATPKTATETGALPSIVPAERPKAVWSGRAACQGKKFEECPNPGKLVSMNEKIIVNGRNEGWLQEACNLASARTPFTLVDFNYMTKENFSFCRAYIEQDYGFKHESEGALVHHFIPLADFARPTHNYPPDFVFSGSPEDQIACQSLETACCANYE